MERKEIICNKCGCHMGDLQLPQKDYVFLKKEWGYFSRKDLAVHEFYLCEECYDELVCSFTIAPIIRQKTEVI